MKSKFPFHDVQKLQAKLAKAQEELSNITVEAKSGGDAVTITMNGQQQVQSVKISPEVVDPQDVDLLEDLVLTAVNEAIEKSQKLTQEHLGSVAGDLGIPGLI